MKLSESLRWLKLGCNRGFKKYLNFSECGETGMEELELHLIPVLEQGRSRLWNVWEQLCPIEFSISALSNTVATDNLWLLST